MDASVDLQGLFDDDDAAAALTNGKSGDPFLLQGDDQTWASDDWHWDPFNMFAAPKETPQVACCQALRRRKAAEPASSTMPADTAQAIAVQHSQCCSAANQMTVLQGQQSACCAAPPSYSAAHQPVAAAEQVQHMVPNPIRTSSLPATLSPQAAMGMNNPAWPVPDFSHAAGGMSQSPFIAAPSMPWACGSMSQFHVPGVPMHSFPPTANYNPAAALQGYMAMPQAHDFAQAQAQQYSQHVMAAVPPPAVAALGTTAFPAGMDCVSSAPAAPSASCAAAAPRCRSRADSADDNSRNTLSRKRQAKEVDPDLSDLDFSGSEDEGDKSAVPSLAGVDLSNVVALHDIDDGKMLCQVAGCAKDLTGLKEYHQRYRICEVHIKLPQVLKDNRLQRFCQQCGRFHDLTAFDGNRKSCRDQLSKHNARRRRRAQQEQQKSKAAAEGAAGGGGGAVASVPGTVEGEVGKLLQTLMQNPTQLHALRLLLGVQTHPALPATGPFTPDSANAGSTADGTTGSEVSDPATYGLARDMMAGRNEFAPSFDSEHRILRVSMKLFNKTPADLPQDLRGQVTSWLGSAPAAMEASIRPGCVFLTMQMLVHIDTYQAATAPGALQGLVDHLLYKTGCAFWWNGVYTVQLLKRIMMISQGKVTSTMSGGSASNYPAVTRMAPLSILSGQPTTFQLAGHNLDQPDCYIVCRWQGHHIKAVLKPLGPHQATVTLPPLPCCGMFHVEVVRGAYLSPSRPLLVVDDPDLAQEISKLETRHTTLSSTAMDCLLVDLGLVLRHIRGDLLPGLSHGVIAEKARRLLAFAADMGWAAVASRVLPLACAKCSCASEIVAAVHASTSQDGLSLLHRAVRSGSAPLVQGILAWGDAHGYRWRVDCRGPNGITPLHLAALMDDARIALMLMDHCGWPAAFTQLRTNDGVTPFHLSFQMGHYAVDHLMTALADTDSGAPHGVLENGKAVSKARPAGDQEGGEAASDLDPCSVCQSTLPPLLLSIMGSCVDCGRRRRCVGEGGGSSCRSACQCSRRAATATAIGDVCCAQRHSTVYSITALCQGCHTNRVMEVA